jgi:RNA-binding protein 25
MSFPPHMPMIPPMPFFPPGAPMMMPPNMATPPPPPPINGALKPAETDKKNRLQTPTTVFVGSISDRAPDAMIKRMLHNCGSVVNWKRVQGANGKLQAFGFCEYENPEGTLRCIRLLNGWQIQDKKLVVSDLESPIVFFCFWIIYIHIYTYQILDICSKYINM